MTAQLALTEMKANVDRPVAAVQIAKDLRLPSLVWIIQAPAMDPGHPATAVLARPDHMLDLQEYKTYSLNACFMASSPSPDALLSKTAGSQTLNMVYAKVSAIYYDYDTHQMTLMPR